MARKRSWVLGCFGLVALVLIGLGVYGVMTGAPRVADHSFLVLDLRGEIIEERPTDMLGRLLEGKKPLLRDIIGNIRKASADDRVDGIIAKVGYLNTGIGKVQEIRDALAEFRTSGKVLVGFMEEGGDKEYYLATVCPRVYLAPLAELLVDGIAAQAVFVRGMFDKLGMVPNVEQVAEYKSAADMLVRKEMSEAHRRVTESLLDSYYGQLLGTMAEGRGRTVEEMRAVVDRGYFSAREALAEGIADSLLYWDQVEELIKKENEGNYYRLKSRDYTRVKASSLGLDRGPRITVVYAVGPIVTGPSSFDPVFGATMGSETICGALEEAREDEGAKAVILRVDSPGGSALASDLIWREIRLTREKKPVIASMSDVAASGGYYVSMGADAIVADAGTVTGSIGVLFGKLNVRGFYEKLGLNKQVLSRGMHAEMFSDIRDFTEEERKKLSDDLWDFYLNDFVAKAAEGRGLPKDSVDAVARGRVWTGEQAKQIGLVTEVGGMRRAIALAKEKAGIPAEQEVSLTILPRPKGILEGVLGADLGALADWLPAHAAREVLALVPPTGLFRRGEMLALMPYRIVAE